MIITAQDALEAADGAPLHSVTMHPGGLYRVYHTHARCPPTLRRNTIDDVCEYLTWVYQAGVWVHERDEG